jgi:hypothetical protein
MDAGQAGSSADRAEGTEDLSSGSLCTMSANSVSLTQSATRSRSPAATPGRRDLCQAGGSSASRTR